MLQPPLLPRSREVSTSTMPAERPPMSEWRRLARERATWSGVRFSSAGPSSRFCIGL